MYITDVNKIQNVIVNLKKAKESSFLNKGDIFRYQDVTETCRVADTILLPLYYIWENCCHRQLKDVCFEEHLKKPYQRFAKKPFTYTWEMYILISLCIPFSRYLENDSIYAEISVIYKEFLELSVLGRT